MQNFTRRSAALRLDIRRARKADARKRRAGRSPAEQRAQQRRKSLILCREFPELYRRARLPGRSLQAADRIPRSIENLRTARRAVAAQRNGHLRPACKELRQDLQLHAVQVGKAVEIQLPSRGKRPRLQRGCKPRQAAGRILSRIGAGGVIALHQEGKFLGLHGQRTAELLRCRAQQLRPQAVGTEFLQRVEQLQQKFRPGRAGTEQLQPRAHLLHSQRHQQQPSARVRLLAGGAALDGKHARGQPGKAQDLGKAADRVAARAAEHAFGLVGELLRHDQDALRRFFAERLHHAGRVLFSARTKPKLQHVPHLFLPIVTHAVRKKKPTPGHGVSCGLLKKPPSQRFRREEKCERKPSGFPFALNNPPQRQNCKIMLQKLILQF